MTAETCDKCGVKHDPTKCNAHSKRSGKQCGRLPMNHTTVCPMHGGKTPNTYAAAERRGELAHARAAVKAHALPTNIDPQTALLQELARTTGWVHYLETKDDQLDEADLVWGRTESVKKRSGEFPGTDTTKAAKPNAWYVILTAERKHLVDVATACIKAGIEERRVQLAEDQGRLIAGAIHQILGRLMLTPEQLQLVPTVVPEALRSLTPTPEETA